MNPLNGYYGPPWPPMYGPPTQGMSPTDIERGMQLAMKFAMREEREKQRKRDRERRERDDYRKQGRTARQNFLVALELYIIGLISYPFVMPLYGMALAAVQK